MMRWRGSQLWIATAFAVVIGYYGWTSRSDHVSWHWREEQNDYYNLLVHGFLDGQLALKADVPAELLACPNPYDPDQRPAGIALHDASLFRGRYYIYYGVVPAMVLLLPFRVLTGMDLPLGAAVLAFVIIGYAGAVALLLAARRRFFSAVGPALTAAMVFALGMLSCTPILLRRSSMYELPIASGYCFATMAIFFLSRTLFDRRRPLLWLALSSTCWGLAIGSRPTYLLAPAVLLFGAMIVARNGTASRRSILAATLAPIAAIGVLLAGYNFARFGNPFEFGVSYILSGVYESKIEHFRLRYVPWNTFAYFFSHGEWGRYFPFYDETPITLARPAQHYGMDIPFGLLANVPFLAVAVIAPAALLRRNAAQPPELRWLIAILLGVVAAPLALLLCFYAAMVRYTGDFAPTLALLACIGVFALSGHVYSTAWMRRAITVSIGALGLVSLFTGFAFSVKVYDRVRAFNPATYATIATIANAPVHALESLRGEPSAGVRLRIVFPSMTAAMIGRREELVATGWASEIDRVFVDYTAADQVQLGFEHAGAPMLHSAPLSISPGVEQRLLISWGSLCPPATHPRLARLSTAMRDQLLQRVHLEWNGGEVVDQYQRTYDSEPRRLRISSADTKLFSGRVIAVDRESLTEALQRALIHPAEPPAISADEAGTLHLRVQFPGGSPGEREPLVVSGETGRADFLLVEYLAGNHLRFVFDHWGRRAYLSPPIAYEPKREYRLTVSHPYYFPLNSRFVRAGDGVFTVTLDDQRVWEFSPLFYPIERSDLFLGQNPLGGSTSGTSFRGEIRPAK